MIFPDLIIIIHNPIPHLILFKLLYIALYIVVLTNLKKINFENLKVWNDQTRQAISAHMHTHTH